MPSRKGCWAFDGEMVSEGAVSSQISHDSHVNVLATASEISEASEQTLRGSLLDKRQARTYLYVVIAVVIRDAVLRSELTRYEIAKRSGIDQAALLRFVRGGSLRIESLEKLCPVLGLRLSVTAVEDERETKSKSARAGSRPVPRRKS